MKNAMNAVGIANANLDVGLLIEPRARVQFFALEEEAANRVDLR
jgi:hypothetical protein